MSLDQLKPHRKIRPVILCGGSGTRLWPLSRARLPKQFLTLKGDRSLMEEALLRGRCLDGAEAPILVAAARHEGQVREALHKTGVEAFLILEPEARNTAAAVAAAALVAASLDDETILMVMPADHLVEGDDDFRRSVAEAVRLAGEGWLTVLGVKPHEPSSAFGYIVRGAHLSAQGSRVERFVEKPARAQAAALIADGALWNAGMVVAKAGIVIEALGQHEPQLVAAVAASIANGERGTDRLALRAKEFADAKKISFDHAVLERHERVAVAPFFAKWRDLGTWREVAELHGADGQGNRGRGDIKFIEAHENFVFSPDRRVLALGVDGLVIVSTEDALLVAAREHLSLLGDAVKNLAEDAQGANGSDVVHYVWGMARTIAIEAQGLVRRLTVLPHKTSSANDHGVGSGHWVVMSGHGTALIGGRALDLSVGQSIATPGNSARNVHNTGDEVLELVEVQFVVSRDDVAPIRRVV